MTDPDTMRRVRQLLLPNLIALGLLLSGCSGSGMASRVGPTRTAPAAIHQVASIATLRDAFNADAGATRLILLVSPT